MGKYSKIKYTRQFSDFSQSSRTILCNVLVDMNFGYIKLHSRESRYYNFEITNEKIRSFLSMLLLNVYHKLPNHKMYCEATPDTFV